MKATTMLPARALDSLATVKSDLDHALLGLAAFSETLHRIAGETASDPSTPDHEYRLAELAEETAERSLDRLCALHTRAENLLRAAVQVATEGKGSEAEGRLLARLLCLISKARTMMGNAHSRAALAARQAFLMQPVLSDLAAEGL